MWHDRSLAVILPTYREKESIRSVIEGFEALGIVDDILVVNNNAEPGTSAEVAATSAREVVEVCQGYGAAIRRGIRETDADLICIFEPDGTFEPFDIWKLLAYAADSDFIYGSRTVRDFIWDGANMGRFLRWGNWAVAKLTEVLFNTSSLSDMGCTMRVVSGPAVRSVERHFTVDGGALGAEMMLLSVIGGWHIVQLPVNYRARVGRAGTTSSFRNALGIGLAMIMLVFRYRFRRSSVRDRIAETEGLPSGVADQPGRGGEPAHLLPWLRFPHVRSARKRREHDRMTSRTRS
jgi:glycosyltransferase involved in cell wall biosynthesis